MLVRALCLTILLSQVVATNTQAANGTVVATWARGGSHRIATQTAPTLLRLGLTGQEHPEVLQMAETLLNADGYPVAIRVHSRQTWEAAQRRLAELQLTYSSPLTTYLACVVESALAYRSPGALPHRNQGLTFGRALITNYPDWKYAHYAMADAYEGSGNLALAEEEWRALLAIDPASFTGRLGLGYCLSANKKFAEAKKVANSLIAETTADQRLRLTQTYALLAAVHRSAEEYASGALACQELLKYADPQWLNYDNYYGCLAYCLNMDKRGDEALAYVTQAEARGVSDGWMHRIAAGIQRDRGNLDEAARHLEIALRLEPFW